MSTRTARMLIALVAVVPLAVAGCSSSTNGKGSAVTTPAVTAPGSSPPASPTPASTSNTSESVTADQAKAALLTAQDVGAGFSTARFQPSSDPLPCAPNDPPLEQQIPSTLEVGAGFVRTGAEFGEDLRLYPDVATADELLSRAANGINCPSGKITLTSQPETVNFGKLQDVTSAVGADKAVAVEGRTAKLDLALVGCRLGRVVVLFTFLRTKSTPTSQLPNPISLVSTAVQKIKNS